MDYTQEILARLRKGEDVSTIADSLTKQINDANTIFKNEQEALENEKQSKRERLEAVENFLLAIGDLLAAYEVDNEILDEIENISAEELMESLDGIIPFLEKYKIFLNGLDLDFDKSKSKDKKKPAAEPVKECIKRDPIEEFLNDWVR